MQVSIKYVIKNQTLKFYYLLNELSINFYNFFPQEISFLMCKNNKMAPAISLLVSCDLSHLFGNEIWI